MVFSKLSDLSNLQNVKQKLENPELVAKLKEQADGDQAAAEVGAEEPGAAGHERSRHCFSFV